MEALLALLGHRWHSFVRFNQGATSFNQMFEFLSSAGIEVTDLPLKSTLDIEREWRAIYGNAFVGRPRLKMGVKAELEFSHVDCSHYWIVPFNFDLAGTPVRVYRHGQTGLECRGKLVPLGEFHNIEFFICPLDFKWTMVHTHEDHAFGGPYFIRSDWIA